jgi:HK97 family phage major capsid protein
MTHITPTIKQQREADNLRVEAAAWKEGVVDLGTKLQAEGDSLSEAEVDKIHKEIDKASAKYKYLFAKADELDGGEQSNRPSYGKTDPKGMFGASHPAFGSTWNGGVTKAASPDPSKLDTGGFGSFGEFLDSVAKAKSGGGFDNRLMAAANTGSSDPYGGFLVPEIVDTQVRSTSTRAADWLRLRNEIMVSDGSSPSLRMPALADRDRSNGDIAGFEMRRTSEATDITGDVVEFRSRGLEQSKSAGLVKVSNELLSDNVVGLDQVLFRLFGEALADTQARDTLTGSGVDEPTGIIGNAVTYEVAKESSQTADTIFGENLLKMRARVKNFANAIWVAHPETITELANARLEGTNSDTFLYRPGSGTDVPDTLMGRPIFYSDKAPRLGEAGDIVVFDPSAYDYRFARLRIDTSVHVAFESDVTVFRVV